MLLLVGQEVLEPRHQYQGLLLPTLVAAVEMDTLLRAHQAALVVVALVLEIGRAHV